MPAAWFINPIVRDVAGTNMPLVETFVDPVAGRMRYLHSSAIYPERGMTWCLSYVTTKEGDFADLEAQPGVFKVFDEELPDEADGASASREAAKTWSRARNTTNVTAIRARLAAVGVGGAMVGMGSTRKEVLTLLGKAAGNNDPREAGFDPEAWYTGHPAP